MPSAFPSFGERVSYFFWMSSKVKQEYFYMAMFALVAAFYQARKMDILVAAFSTE